MEEDGVEVCEGGEEAAVIRDVAVGDGAAGRHEGVMTEAEPGSRYSLELATKVREGFTIYGPWLKTPNNNTFTF